MKDKRYSIALEWCGHEKPMHVVRFCDRWVGCAINKTAAQRLANEHARQRNAVLFDRAGASNV
jgi:hypothetical protein